MQRYGTTPFILVRQPRPGDRETRYRPAPDRTFRRPRLEQKEEHAHV